MGTHSYAVLEVSDAAFEEIKGKLEKAGYSHQFDTDPQGRNVIDMHGIALQTMAPVDTQTPDMFKSDADVRTYMEEHHGQLPPTVNPPDLGCKLPPEGWYCSREPGHEGPCAARPVPASHYLAQGLPLDHTM